MRSPKQLSLYTDWYALQLDWERAILATYLQASAAQIVEGKRWYPQAIAALEEIRNSEPEPMHSKRVAAICAVLSPRVSWELNVKGTRAMVRAASQGLRVPPTMAGVRRNVERAWDIANGADLTIISGPKVSSFYANLCGDFQRVTCDTWAARAAGIDDKHHNHLDRQRYKHLEIAYQTVAKELEFKPAELQAICWIVARGKGE